MFSSKDFAVSENTVKINSIPPNFWTDLCTGKGAEFRLTVSVSPEIAGLLCPSCGYNLGIKTLGRSNETKSHVHSKHKASSNPDPKSNSRRLSQTAERKHCFDESEFPVCNADYGIYNTRTRHRTLSELLRLDKTCDQNCVQPDENKNGFSNDWVKNDSQDQAQVTRKKKSTLQNGWWSAKENGESRNTENVHLHSRNNSFENSHKESHANRKKSLNERIIIEQNSRTLLRDRKIVQKMRNCWERFLKIRLQTIEMSEDDEKRNDFIGHSQQNNTGIKNTSQNRKCSACGRRKTIPVNSKQGSMTEETTTISVKNENRNNKEPEDHQSIASKKKTFIEIRNCFELGALQHVERIPGESMQQSNIIDKIKAEKQQPQHKKEPESTRKLSPMSSQDKVKLWMEQNDSAENSGSTSDSDHFLSAKNYSSHSKFSSQSDTNVYRNNTFDESKWNCRAGSIKDPHETNSIGFKVSNKNTTQRAGHFQQLKSSTQNQRIQTSNNDSKQKSPPPVPHLSCE